MGLIEWHVSQWLTLVPGFADRSHRSLVGVRRRPPEAVPQRFCAHTTRGKHVPGGDPTGLYADSIKDIIIHRLHHDYPVWNVTITLRENQGTLDRVASSVDAIIVFPVEPRWQFCHALLAYLISRRALRGITNVHTLLLHTTGFPLEYTDPHSSLFVEV